MALLVLLPPASDLGGGAVIAQRRLRGRRVAVLPQHRVLVQRLRQIRQILGRR